MRSKLPRSPRSNTMKAILLIVFTIMEMWRNFWNGSVAPNALAYTRTICSTTWAHCSRNGSRYSLSRWWAGGSSKLFTRTKYLSTPITFSLLQSRGWVKPSVWRSWNLMPTRKNMFSVIVRLSERRSTTWSRSSKNMM